MALRDTEAFLRQRAADFDPNLDTSPGSPFDAKVIQPMVRRNGIDPFTVDLLTFTQARLQQLYPKLATDDGDNITDLLIKPSTLLWDPLVRETTRVLRGLSFADPSTLTLEEADSLGGNFFVPRRRGNLSRGPARIFFASPQNSSITQNNFVTSRGGLVFFPTEVQSIRSEEMLLNVNEEGLYFFDINVVASDKGDAYNITVNELVSIANLEGAVRVTNLRRFRFGEDEETPTEYANRLSSSLGEKSMNTLRGIAAKLLEGFPEVQRLNVVGFGDPEMQRDVIKGGGLGAPVAGGSAGVVTSDTEGKLLSRRFSTTEVDFQALVGLSATGLVLSLVNPDLGGPNDPFGTTEIVRDIGVRDVVSATELDLEEQVLVLGASGLPWTLRKRELTLSSIPGGILFPDGPNGTVDIPDDEVHIGGAHDIHVRTTDFDDATLTVANVTDDEPLLSGVDIQVTATSPGSVTLFDLVLGTDYAVDDATYQALENAGREGYSLQIQNGPNAGTYRVVSAVQTPGSSPVLVLAEDLTLVEATPRRWRLFDQINIDMVEPKETRITDTDLVTVQGSDLVSTVSGTDFDAFGVAKGDTLRILEGPEAGDYELVEDPIAPSFDQLRIDRAFPRTLGATRYVIFRPNNQTLVRPLVRVRSIELLDSSSQPQGSFIPYAKPVDVQTRAFQNPARGVKHDFRDARVGLLTREATSGSFPGVTAGQFITLTVFKAAPISTIVTFAAGNPTVATVISLINTALETLTGSPNAAVQVGERVGIRPVDSGVVAVTDGTARTGLFGNTGLQTTADVQSDDVTFFPGPGKWGLLEPTIDDDTGLDVVQVVDGVNAGFYPGPFLLDIDVTTTYPNAGQSRALILADSVADLLAGRNTNFLAPEDNRRVRVGARSLGSARVFFLEPTSFEVDKDTLFSLDLEDGTARFFPDPTLSFQQIPPLPDGDTPVDGSSPDGSSTFTSASQEFILSNIKEGDELVIKTFPLTGDVVLPDPVPNLAGKTFIFSLNGGPDRTLTFIRDDVSLNPNEVSRESVAAQINAKAGIELAEIDSADRLRLFTELDLVVRKGGTALGPSGPFLGILGNILGHTPTKAFADEDTTNESPHAGTYEVADVPTGTTLDIVGSFPLVTEYVSPITEQTFIVQRTGVQRISTTQMEDNTAEAGLFYFDVELVSEGAGDFWNVTSNLQMTVSGFRSDGYFLTTDDENLTFSDVEKLKLVISRTILESGVDDDPRNATQVTGQNILIRYDRSTAVTSVQNFAQSDFERAVAANPLARHLIPHFVRFDATYFGGSAESVVVPDLEKLIRELFPIDSLDASAIQKKITDRGATKVTNPLTLLAIVHNVDRTITAQRSQDSLSTGRLSAFVPDLLNVVRNTT